MVTIFSIFVYHISCVVLPGCHVCISLHFLWNPIILVLVLLASFQTTKSYIMALKGSFLGPVNFCELYGNLCESV